MMSNAWTLSGSWLFPVDQPPLERGILTIEGTLIVSVDPHGSRSVDVDLGHCAILPGLVNAHTHLDLTGARGHTSVSSSESFTQWLKKVIAFRIRRSDAEVQQDIADGVAELVKTGTTLIGDISVGGMSLAALQKAPLRATIFGEIIGLQATRYQQNRDRWLALIKSKSSNEQNIHFGLSPHAPYSVDHASAIADMRKMTTAMHIAESATELQLLHDGTGHFRQFLEELGVYCPKAITANWPDFYLVAPPVEHQQLLVHGNLLPADLQLASNQSICYCPRTHHAFGHEPHKYQTWLASGNRICLGTDSLASNPDLDILAEASFLWQRDQVPGDVLLPMITIAGAEALGWGAEVGTLTVGKSADCVVIPLATEITRDPHELLFCEIAANRIRRTLYRGRWQEA